MASALNKVQATMNGDTLRIFHQTIYGRKIQFEIQDDDAEEQENITKISFLTCFMMKFPGANCLLEIVPNLNQLELRRTKLTRIDPWNLQGFENLVELNLARNEIEELPSDLFTHTPNLQHISFEANKVKVISGEGILEPLKDLKSFDLRGNPGIDAFYHHEIAGVHIRCPTLVQFKEAIMRCKPAQNIWSTVVEHENLKRKFEAHEKEMIDLKKLCIEQGAKIERLEKKLERAKQGEAFNKLDFTIEINGKAFNVKKEILAANSPLLADLIRENEDADTLELKDISEEVFKEILNFMVKKTQPKPTANFIKLYAASGRLQMKELMDLCAHILMGKVTQENALEILNLCKKYPNIELGKKALDEVKKIYEEP